MVEKKLQPVKKGHYYRIYYPQDDDEFIVKVTDVKETEKVSIEYDRQYDVDMEGICIKRKPFFVSPCHRKAFPIHIKYPERKIKEIKREEFKSICFMENL